MRQRNNRYRVGELLLAILSPMLLGPERIESPHLLQPKGVFRYLSGLPTYPHPSTLRRFLLRMAPQALPRVRRLHDRFLAQMTVKPQPPSRLIFDLDSTVLVVYGNQEEARGGATPDQARTPIVPSTAVFRRTDEGLLAWGVASGSPQPEEPSEQLGKYRSQGLVTNLALPPLNL